MMPWEPCFLYIRVVQDFQLLERAWLKLKICLLDLGLYWLYRMAVEVLLFFHFHLEDKVRPSEVGNDRNLYVGKTKRGKYKEKYNPESSISTIQMSDMW